MWVLWITINGTLSIYLSVSIYLPTYPSLYLSTWQSVTASLLHAVASEVLNKRCGSCCLVNRMEEAVGVTNHQAICDTELCFVHPDPHHPQFSTSSPTNHRPQFCTSSPTNHHPQFCTSNPTNHRPQFCTSSPTPPTVLFLHLKQNELGVNSTKTSLRFQGGCYLFCLLDKFILRGPLPVRTPLQINSAQEVILKSLLYTFIVFLILLFSLKAANLLETVSPNKQININT